MKLYEIVDKLISSNSSFLLNSTFKNDITKIDKSIEIFSVENDASNVTSNSIFVAIKGTEHDGHHYIKQARDNGAIFIVGTKSSDEDEYQPDLVVDNSRALLGLLSSIINNEPSKSLSIFGVTGTNGKTTTTFLLSSIFNAMSIKNSVIGTTGIYIDGIRSDSDATTPNSIVLQKTFSKILDRGVKNISMEVSSHALDQYRVLGTCFKSVGFTNLSQDHLDYHKDFDQYFEAKSKLFNGEYSTMGVINIDDEWGVKLKAIALNNSMQIMTTSTKSSDADLSISINSVDITGSNILIEHKENGIQKEKAQLKINLIGDFNCENLAIAIGMLLQSGYSFEELVSASKSNIFVPGRLERISGFEKNYEVFIDYAHTPDALEKTIKVLKPLSKRLIVVFGCGGDRDKSKRPIMGKVASQFSDQIILTNDNPRSENPGTIIKDIEAGIEKSEISKTLAIEDRYDAIEYALSIANSGDCVLIAGKGHETYQEFSDGKIDFSDVDTVVEILKKVK